jgi:hypothetical protein
MQQPETISLARQERPDFRSDVALDLLSDGSIKMDACDSGSSVEKVWNHEDYERWMTIPADAVPKLAFALLKEKFADNLDAVDQFKDFCERCSIRYEWSSYP